MPSAEWKPFWIHNDYWPLRKIGSGVHHVWAYEGPTTVSIRRTQTGKGQIIPTKRWAATPHVPDTKQNLAEVILVLKNYGKTKEQIDVANIKHMCPVKPAKRS